MESGTTLGDPLKKIRKTRWPYNLIVQLLRSLHVFVLMSRFQITELISYLILKSKENIKTVK